MSKVWDLFTVIVALFLIHCIFYNAPNIAKGTGISSDPNVMTVCNGLHRFDTAIISGVKKGWSALV